MRLCSIDANLKIRLLELKADLISRGYNAKIIDDALTRVQTIPREEALKKVEKKVSDREVLAVTFHPSLPSISRIVKKHWKVMCEMSPKLAKIFPVPSIVAYRRAKNLRDFLVKATIPNRKSSRQLSGFTKCSRASCILCAMGEKATTHKDHKSGQEWKIKRRIDCCTTNVVYKISCRKCRDFVYIGETGRRFTDRFQEHRGYVSQKKDHPVGNHFNQKGHTIADMIPMAIEEVLPKGDRLLRERRESLWISRYDSVESGANRRN